MVNFSLDVFWGDEESKLNKSFGEQSCDKLVLTLLNAKL